jgi:uncharacterized protein YggE
MKSRFLIAFFCLCTTSVAVQNASGQFLYPDSPLGSGIMVSGSETIPVKPTKLRLVMWVKAEGTDAKAALQALAAHRTKVKQDLIAMKAEEASITFSGSRLQSGDNQDESASYVRMQMMRASGASPNEAAAPEVVTAMAAVKAEWSLPVQEGDALALIPATLKEQIKARDLAGEKNKAELSAEAQEQMEEMAAMMQEEYGYYGGGDAQAATAPKIDFLGSVSQEQVQLATKAAFNSAFGKASALADATGQKLGSLTSLYNNTSNENMEDYAYMGYGQSKPYPTSLTETDERVVAADNPEELQMRITVMAGYALAKD